MPHSSPSDEFTEALRARDMKPVRVPRRAFLLGSTALTGLLGFRTLAHGQEQWVPPAMPLRQPDRDAYLSHPTDEPWKRQGAGPSELGRRSPFVNPKRHIGRPGGRLHDTGSSTDWRGIIGTITPSDLCFERHHAGVPLVDPGKYRLLVHGLVERPMIFTLEDLMRLGAESRFLVWECQGNGGYRPSGGRIDETVTILDTLGRSSAAEWIGVPVRTIMEMVGVRAEARWALVESMDAASLARSGDLDKLWNDAYLMYGQNGEPLRPENGYPVRLLMPGYEGNISNKWIRRIEFGRTMFQMREETSKYADHLPDGRTWQYSVMCETRSHITVPSGGMQLPYRGPMEIRGIAWSGRGAIARVEVSTDGGRSWKPARLHEPVLPKMATLFTLPWRWDGEDIKIKSRAIDVTGNKQPSHEYIAQHGPRGVPYNAIQTWHIHPNGTVTHAWA